MSNIDLRAVAILVGRLMLATLFILEGVYKAGHFTAAMAYMDAHGVPGVLLPGAILLELGGGVLIALGLYVRPVAAIFALFCVAAAILFHGHLDRGDLLHLEKDFAIAGGFLLLAVFGPGALSIDNAHAPLLRDSVLFRKASWCCHGSAGTPARQPPPRRVWRAIF
jgi:putative oxidoreductase